MASPKHAGMTEPCSQIVVPQIGMGIKMDDVQIRPLPGSCPYGTECHQMFPAEEQRQLTISKNHRRPFFYIGQGLFRTAETQFHIATVKNPAVFQIFILIRAVRFQAKTFMTYGRRAKAGAGAETRRRIEGSTVKDDA